MKHFLFGIGSWLLVPVALWQGIGVRRRIRRMPPPPGLPFGREGEGEPELKVLVIGDSSAAGVGAAQMTDTLGPQIARRLSARTGGAVAWRNAGANSATCEQLRDHVLPHLAGADAFTHVVITAGTNDMKNFLPRHRFKAGFGGLLYAIHAKWPGARVIWSPIIDMRTVPCLPRALGEILQLRVRMLNELGERLCFERAATAAPELVASDIAGFAEDGFHASALGYGHWADILVDVIAGESPPSAPSRRAPEARSSRSRRAASAPASRAGG